jgi:predicted O-methyltransferase YrrM
MPFTTAKQAYLYHLGNPSDIRDHLPTLYSYARGVVVELGTRGGVSTAALLAGVERRGGTVTSIDVEDCSQHFAGHPMWNFVQGNSTDPGVAPTKRIIDVLFIDTEHTDAQLSAELKLWAPLVKPGGVIICHDTETFPGVRAALDRYCKAQGWQPTYVLPCHGLGIVEVPQ